MILCSSVLPIIATLQEQKYNYLLEMRDKKAIILCGGKHGTVFALFRGVNLAFSSQNCFFLQLNSTSPTELLFSL